MDMTDSIAPKSDQLNADDLLAGPRTVQVENVTEGAEGSAGEHPSRRVSWPAVSSK